MHSKTVDAPMMKTTTCTSTITARHRSTRCHRKSVSAVTVLLMVLNTCSMENIGSVRAWSSSKLPPTRTNNKYKVQTAEKTALQTNSKPSSLLPCQLQQDQKAEGAYSRQLATPTNTVILPRKTAKQLGSEHGVFQRMEDLFCSTSSGRAMTSVDRVDNNSDWIRTQLLPVLSAACLITGNTVGAGCLVIPEIASGPGMAPTTGLFAAAYAVNWLSGLVIAEICCVQKDSATKPSGSDVEAKADTTASFTAMAKSSLSNPLAAQFIWAVCIFVNSCVMAFDVGRAGVVGSNLLQSSSSVWMLSTLPQQLENMLGTTADLGPGLVSALWAATVMGLLCKFSSQQLSRVAAACVTAVFVSFGGLALPGLAAVTDPLAIWLQPGTAAASETGSTETLMTSLGHAAPVILVSMLYQNIVPTVAKILNYERLQIVLALTLGSAMPLFMYLSWCMASLGGGIDTSSLTSAVALASSSSDSMPSWTMGLLAVFSMATLAGSSLGAAMTLSGEYTSLLHALGLGDKSSADDMFRNGDDGTVSPAAAMMAVSIPLLAAWGFAAYSPNGITTALSLAGSFGSPILYGVLPAWMAWNVRQQAQEQQEQEDRKKVSKPWFLPKAKEEQKEVVPDNLVPALSLPLLGVLATGFMGEEMAQRVSEILQKTSSVAEISPTLAEAIASSEATTVVVAALS